MLFDHIWHFNKLETKWLLEVRPRQKLVTYLPLQIDPVKVLSFRSNKTDLGGCIMAQIQDPLTVPFQRDQITKKAFVIQQFKFLLSP